MKFGCLGKLYERLFMKEVSSFSIQNCYVFEGTRRCPRIQLEGSLRAVLISNLSVSVVVFSLRLGERKESFMHSGAYRCTLSDACLCKL